jgi:hypothetical protein
MSTTQTSMGRKTNANGHTRGRTMACARGREGMRGRSLSGSARFCDYEAKDVRVRAAFAVVVSGRFFLISHFLLVFISAHTWYTFIFLQFFHVFFYK